MYKIGLETIPHILKITYKKPLIGVKDVQLFLKSRTWKIDRSTTP
jgi:hypothetical protein